MERELEKRNGEKVSTEVPLAVQVLITDPILDKAVTVPAASPILACLEITIHLNATTASDWLYEESLLKGARDYAYEHDIFHSFKKLENVHSAAVKFFLDCSDKRDKEKEQIAAQIQQPQGWEAPKVIQTSRN